VWFYRLHINQLHFPLLISLYGSIKLGRETITARSNRRAGNGNDDPNLVGICSGDGDRELGPGSLERENRSRFLFLNVQAL
jgi:hypothetical protein